MKTAGIVAKGIILFVQPHDVRNGALTRDSSTAILGNYQSQLVPRQALGILQVPL